MMQTQIRTLADLVECLGGEQRVAHACDVPTSEVRRWLEWGELPRGFHLLFFVRATIAGRRFDQMALQSMFGLSASEAEAFCRSVDGQPREAANG